MGKSLVKFTVFFYFVIFLSFACSDSDSESGPQPPPATGPIVAGDPAQTVAEFEEILERLQGQLNIPGMSAAIVENRRIVWAKAFGYADVGTGVEATPTTSFHLASLTKTFASTIIMQLVVDGQLDLEEPVSSFGTQLDSSGTVQVKHLLTHTSEGAPGTVYRYNGGRFALLDTVIQEASGRSFCDLLVERIIEPMELEHTAPNPLSVDRCYPETAAEQDAFEQNMAQGYTSNGQNPESYPDYFGTAAGLVSSVLDVARYSIAIDNNMFLSQEVQDQVFSPAISENGETLAYGLGWFVQNHSSGLKFVWHYGYWTANSSLIVKVPERELAFVILANTDMLSRAFPGIGSDANVERSVVAEEFLNAFVFGNAELPDPPY